MCIRDSFCYCLMDAVYWSDSWQCSVTQLTIAAEKINTCMKVSHTCPAAVAASAGCTTNCTSSNAGNQQNEINKEGYFRNSYCIQLLVAMCPKRRIQLQAATCRSISHVSHVRGNPKRATNCQNLFDKFNAATCYQHYTVADPYFSDKLLSSSLHF